MDIIGVIPDPAAISTWCPGSPGSGVKAPVGGSTSTVSPRRTPCTSQSENSPPGTTRTPIRGGAPAGEQMEYERRSSRPSTVRRRVRDCPGRWANSAASSSGISKPTVTASSHSGLTSATRSSWKTGRRRGRTAPAAAVLVGAITTP